MHTLLPKSHYLQQQQRNAHHEIRNTTFTTTVDPHSQQHPHLHSSKRHVNNHGEIGATPSTSAPAPPTLCYEAIDDAGDVYIDLTDLEGSDDEANGASSGKKRSLSTPLSHGAKRAKRDDTSPSDSLYPPIWDEEEDEEPKTPAKSTKIKHGVAYTNEAHIVAYHSPDKLAFDLKDHTFLADPFQRLRDISINFDAITDNDLYSLNRSILARANSGTSTTSSSPSRVMHLSMVLAEANYEIRTRLARGTSRPASKNKPRVASSDKWGAIHMVDRLLNAGFLVTHRDCRCPCNK
jgi:hypothetical protein